jgi:hypothetical protein
MAGNTPEDDDERRARRSYEAPGDAKVLKAAAVMQRELAGQHKLALGALEGGILSAVAIHESPDPSGFTACRPSRLPE